jgi:hypothetical protein
VFGNRAYTPNAKVILQRIDPGAAKYDDPLLIQTKYGDSLTLTAHLPDGSASNSYYRWQSGRWIPLDAQAWRRDLAKRLPQGTSMKTDVWPDVDTMSVRVPFSQRGESGPGNAVADVEFALAKGRFTVKNVQLKSKGD